jgi:phytoene dehydrogenase-like protein
MAQLDAIIVGGGHNGLLAATVLARSGRSALILERNHEVGGAAVSVTPFPGIGAHLSRYAYLISLLPRALAADLGVRLRPRWVASYTPSGDRGLLIPRDRERRREAITAFTGDPAAFEQWERFHATMATVARRAFPTLTEPLIGRDQMRQLIDADAWRSLFEDPLGAVLERTFDSDLIRGIVLTDALIGTFAPAGDPALRQNRCFLYHVIGNGTGDWDVPVGGMGALRDALLDAAQRAGVRVHTGAEAVSIVADADDAEVVCAGGARHRARHVLAGVAPATLAELLGDPQPSERPEGSQLKLNMLLGRLPRLRDLTISPAEAFAGTFHVHEGYAELQRAYEQAASGQIPTAPPCELYCHTLTDPTILSPELRAAGAHTLTLFGLHMPARLFDRPGAKEQAVAATLDSLNSVLAEPIEDCLWRDRDGAPCLEALTPPELEAELGMPGGHIFHRDLSWPFAEHEREIGQWGVETARPNVWLCGAGARRGGGVSGIPGLNAARAVLAAGIPSA